MKFLAFDTSTDVMSIAVTDGARVWAHTGPGGAQSSATLIPAILALLAEAQLALDALDAIVFGRGPGSFTGLRTACSVAQGLALGAGVKVLPIDTLMALAEEARLAHASPSRAGETLRITALLDARMDEMYVQSYEFSHGSCLKIDECRLIRPENLLDHLSDRLLVEAPSDAINVKLLAGNVFGVYANRLPSARGTKTGGVAWLAIGFVGIITYCGLRNQPFFYDANSYVLAAHGIAEKGLLGNWYHVELRTYGYPLFLHGAFKIADWFHVGPTTSIFTLQWSLFVASARFATNSFFRSARTRRLAFVAVAANPLLVVYAPQALTESLTVSCVLVVVGSLSRAALARRGTVAAAWLVVGATTSSLAMEVRPSNLLIPACFVLAAGGVVLWTRSPSRWPSKVLTAAVVTAASVLPVVPQIMINQQNFQRLTPLPVYDLAGLQSRDGLALIRYGSNVSTDCGDPALRFLNPTKPPVATRPSQALHFYLLSWPEGPETAALHIFSGLDPRPFLTYQHDFGATYERWLQAFVLALLIAGTAGVAAVLSAFRAGAWKRRMDVGFLGVVTLGSVAILATSAAEFRFGVLPILTISLAAAVALGRLRRLAMRTTGLLVGTYLAGLLLWFALSDLVLATSSVWQQCA